VRSVRLSRDPASPKPCLPRARVTRKAVSSCKKERDSAQVAFDRAVAEMRPEARITEEKIAAFADAMRESITTGDRPFRRAYIRSVVDQVELDDTEIRIKGRRNVLERLVMGGGASPAGVPSFVRNWRTRHDSNV
jgi:site-specific DNA recombinase